MLDEMMQRTMVYVTEMAIPLSLDDILGMVDSISSNSAAYFYDPDLNSHFFAFGAAAQKIVSGQKRFVTAKRFVEDLQRIVEVTSRSKIRVFGGFAFEARAESRAHPWQGWPDGKLFLPIVLLEHNEMTRNTRATVSMPMGRLPVSLPPKGADKTMWQDWVVRTCQAVDKQGNQQVQRDLYAQVKPAFASTTHEHESRLKTGWIHLVEKGSGAVQAGHLKKVVLARCVTEPIHCKISVAIKCLQHQYPHNFTFAFWHEATSFIGSSPERLASVTAGTLHVDCLAGSERRGATPDEDADLGTDLLTSSKNRAEHQTVVDWVSDKIRPLVTDLTIASKPVLKKLSNVQHLYTPVQGVVQDGIALFEIVDALHPTPAVAGVPRKEAMQFIRNYEQIDRGWYAGPMGWVDLNGNGTFAVALRSGLVIGEKAVMFAGGGIMGDSEPETEWDETELKFMPMRDALAGKRLVRQNEEK